MTCPDPTQPFTIRIDRMLQERPATKGVMSEHAGHDLHLEQARAWFDALEAFLR